MSNPLSGEHYCFAHQGNHSYYSVSNCSLCRTRRDGYVLAMRVLQSDLYKQLDDVERAACDSLIGTAREIL